jgi:hypothetical protein
MRGFEGKIPLQILSNPSPSLSKKHSNQGYEIISIPLPLLPTIHTHHKALLHNALPN